MIEEIKNIKSSKSDLRKFGITISVVLSLWGALFLWKGKGIYPIFFTLSVAFLTFALVLPKFLKPIQKVWMTFTISLGWIITRIILCAVFYLVFAPTGLIARLFGNRFLDLNFNQKVDTYWIKVKALEEKSKDSYENQF